MWKVCEIEPFWENFGFIYYENVKKKSGKSDCLWLYMTKNDWNPFNKRWNCAKYTKHFVYYCVLRRFDVAVYITTCKIRFSLLKSY